MNEFSLINTYFKSKALPRSDVVFGIGDDAACLTLPPGMQLLVSCDTLVADVHFLSTWNSYDIAWKAAMVNISDIAAMGGTPCWLTLALTLPQLDESWLRHFSQGLHDALAQYNITLIGGDTTRGPLSMTLTIHGTIPEGKAIRRMGASPGDKIYVSGELGAAALAVHYLRQTMDETDRAVLMDKLLRPKPRIDLAADLQSFATAAIDISDGLSADLGHICEESTVGATLFIDKLPIHPLVKAYQDKNALDFALRGGDDYELCFTVASENEAQLLSRLEMKGIKVYPVGVIEEKLGLRSMERNGAVSKLEALGYRHF